MDDGSHGIFVTVLNEENSELSVRLVMVEGSLSNHSEDIRLEGFGVTGN